FGRTRLATPAGRILRASVQERTTLWERPDIRWFHMSTRRICLVGAGLGIALLFIVACCTVVFFWQWSSPISAYHRVRFGMTAAEVDGAIGVPEGNQPNASPSERWVHVDYRRDHRWERE